MRASLSQDTITIMRPPTSKSHASGIIEYSWTLLTRKAKVLTISVITKFWVSRTISNLNSVIFLRMVVLPSVRVEHDSPLSFLFGLSKSMSRKTTMDPQALLIPLEGSLRASDYNHNSPLSYASQAYSLQMTMYILRDQIHV